VDTASAKMAVLKHPGFSPIGYFPLPEYCWLDNYYRPMQRCFLASLERQENSEAARAIVAAERIDISLHERPKTSVTSGYCVARKVGP
jgi:hypothetical protein